MIDGVCMCSVFLFSFLPKEKKKDCGKWSTCFPTGPVTIRMDFPLADCATELILVKCLFGCRSSGGAGDSVCQINTFTDEARNDLITLSQYTCVWEVGGASGGSGEGDGGGNPGGRPARTNKA